MQSNKCIQLAAFIFALLTFIFLLVSLILSSPPFFSECSSDNDCVGEESICVQSKCHCDVIYPHAYYRCDHLYQKIDPFGVLTLLCLGISITLCLLYSFLPQTK